MRCAPWFLILVLGTTVAAQAQTFVERSASSSAAQTLDAAAFKGVDEAITKDAPDVQSAVVVLRGRVVFEFYRDGSSSELRDVQSVAKSALSSLVGIAVAQGQIKSLDQTVVGLMPEWAPLNSDSRAASITVRHLLTMTAGFEVNDASGTASAARPSVAWARPLSSAPGETFAYDNSLIWMLSSILERATAMPLAEYARQQLVAPLSFKEPSYRNGLQLRTLDMAKLGQLYLQNGKWDDRQLLPEAYVAAATHPQNAGGPPVSMPYGYMWWVVPTNSPKKTFFASGFGGQFIWVHPPLDLVIAATSAVSAESNRRGQALQVIRTQLFAGAQRRAAGERQ